MMEEKINKAKMNLPRPLDETAFIELNGNQLKTLLCLNEGVPLSECGLSYNTYKQSYIYLYEKGWVSMPWKQYLLWIKMVKLEEEDENT